MIKKGMVLEVDNGKVGIMTAEGEFFYVVKNHTLPELGDEYEGKLYRSKTFFSFKSRVFLTAASIVLAFNALLVYNLFFSVYDTYEVNINPSIKLYTNRVGKIIKSEGLNQDGVKLLSNINIKNKDIESGLETIVDEAKKLNYLNENNYNVSITDSKNENKDFSKLNKKITEYQKELKNKNNSIIENKENSLDKVNEEPDNIDPTKDYNNINNNKNINSLDNTKNADKNTKNNTDFNGKAKHTNNSSNDYNKNIKENNNNKLNENNSKKDSNNSNNKQHTKEHKK
jgi:hypothetical protein